jgi:hypothetical protein
MIRLFASAGALALPVPANYERLELFYLKS